MSILFFITYIFIILSVINSQNPIQKYVIRRDFFAGFKASEYTVYDVKEKHVYYRIESEYGILQNIKLIAYPSKQKVGELQAKIKLFLYKAEFSIIDPQSNQRINGLIEENFKLNGILFAIEWNGYRITMEKEIFSLTNVFYDSNDKQILAQFRVRPGSVFWKKKYDMKIFSNKYPEQIYLLGLAAFDKLVSGSKNG